MRKIHEPHVGIINQLKCGDKIQEDGKDIDVACLNRGVIYRIGSDEIEIEKVNLFTGKTSKIHLSEEEINELINFVT